MPRKSVLSIALIIAVVMAACSVLKKEDPDQAVRAFLVSFQNSLSKSDQEILKQFRVRQSPEAVLMVIRLLQNKEKYFHCEAQFGSAFVGIEENDDSDTAQNTDAKMGLANSNGAVLAWLSWVPNLIVAELFIRKAETYNHGRLP